MPLLPRPKEGQRTQVAEVIKVPGEPTRREADRSSLLSIPPYASQEKVEGEEPTLHRPEVVEPPEIFQRSGEQGS